MLKKSTNLLAILLLSTFHLINATGTKSKPSPLRRLTLRFAKKPTERTEKRYSHFAPGFESALASVQEAEAEHMRTKETWWPELHQAIKDENTESLCRLLNIEQENSSSASSSSSIDMKAKLRKELRSDFSLVNESNAEKNEFPLLLAARYEKDRIVTFLLNHNADPNKKTFAGNSALHEAAWQGNLHSIIALVNAGAQTDLPNTYGNTSLHRAVLTQKSSAAVVKYLIQHTSVKNSAHQKNSHGRSPLDYAQGRGDEKMIQALLSGESVYQRLKPLDRSESPEPTRLEPTAPPLSPDTTPAASFETLPTPSSENPVDHQLRNALNTGDRYGAAKFIRQGAHPTIQGNHGTILHLAALQKALPIISTLHEEGHHILIDPNITNTDGQNILHILAAKLGDKEATKLAQKPLDLHGTSALSTSYKEKTPLEIAAERNNSTMVNTFLKYIPKDHESVVKALEIETLDMRTRHLLENHRITQKDETSSTEGVPAYHDPDEFTR